MTIEAKWQPIETAPRDGTVILVHGLDYSNLEAYGLTHWVKEVREYWEYKDDDTQKRVKADESHWDYSFEGFPTHWMPLPAPPSKVEG